MSEPTHRTGDMEWLLREHDEMRQLGHLVVFEADGTSNVPGVFMPQGPELDRQLARQRERYGK